MIHQHQIAPTLKISQLPGVVSKVDWQGPQPQWWTLNFDGSFDYVYSTAGIGGIIRNSKGDMIFAYADSEVVHQAELLALLKGLLTLTQPSLPQGIIIEGDALNVISTYQHHKTLPWAVCQYGKRLSWRYISLLTGKLSIFRDH